MIARNIAVVVGGDLGRSARSVRHAEAFAARGARVTLLGYADTPLPHLDGIEIVVVPSFDALRRRGLTFLFFAVIRQLALLFAWSRALRRAKYDLILVQNPPALPAVLVALLFAHGAPVVIDWHNTTSAVLGLRSPTISSLFAPVELALARRATAHLTVSDALTRWLHVRSFEATTVYDAPRRRETFAPSRTAEEAVIVVPGSWTDDDDFTLLEETALAWDGPPIRFLLTGTGPRRAAQMARFERLAVRSVTFECRWFAPDQYAQGLATTDLGLSIHRSASGLDLPMKIVELFESGVPVCVLDSGAALRERFVEGRGVRFFADFRSLVARLKELLEGWPHAKRLDALRASVHDALPRSWDEEWSECAEPLIQRLLSGRRPE